MSETLWHQEDLLVSQPYLSEVSYMSPGVGNLKVDCRQISTASVRI
ncbi:MAG: hypothetical protein KHY47_01390 [Prevotella sp.]|nr:hypothetical protein [Prevotella sp.]